MKSKKLAQTILFVCALLFLTCITAGFCPKEECYIGKLYEISTYSTNYSNSSMGRKENIRLAISAIDGYILTPKTQFSFNEVVGERSEKRGYKQAKVILKGEYVDGLGGGVCQVSSTLYNAVLFAGLEILEARPHTYLPSYVPPSFDCAVSYGYKDLRFYNNTDSPIVIRAKADGKKITISILSCKSPEYTLKGKWVKLRDVLPNTKYIEQDLGDDGVEEQVIFGGSNGLLSEGYLEYYKDGKYAFTKKIRLDKYFAQDRIVARGLHPALTDNEPT